MAENIKTKVLIAASEFEPFTNIGHLGRVVQNLSVELHDRFIAGGNAELSSGIEVRVVMPRYAAIPAQFLDSAKPLLEFDANLGRRVYPCSIYETEYRGVTVYLLSCGSCFDKEQVYSSEADDVERFSCFCNAVLAMLPRIDYNPDIVQCHDWHMSYIPTLYKTNRNRRYSDKALKTLFVIHSMQYQGKCSRYEILDYLDLPTEFFTPSTLEFYDGANSLKGGLVFSDWLATVSPNHANEIQHAYYGENLEGLIRARSSEITGIMCGIDKRIYNPALDGRIIMQYDADTVTKNKPANKLWLQEWLGFERDACIPLLLVVYDEQDYDKGMDLIKFVFDDIVKLGIQLVIASKGKSDNHEFFQAKAEEFPEQVAYVRYSGVIWDGEQCSVWDGAQWSALEESSDPDLSEVITGGSETAIYGGGVPADSVQVERRHYIRRMIDRDMHIKSISGRSVNGAADTRKIIHETMLFGGCDILLRPSRIEPCGEKHLIALKYGVLPIVRETGGLKDVVIPYDDATGEGNGFSFFNYNAHDMLYTIHRAVDICKNDRETWNRLVTTAMNTNVTWDAAATAYIEIYRMLIEAH